VDPWKSLDVSFQVISALAVHLLGAGERGGYSGNASTGWVVRDSNLGTGKDYLLLQKKKKVPCIVDVYRANPPQRLMLPVHEINHSSRRLRMTGVIPLLPLYAFMAYSGNMPSNLGRRSGCSTSCRSNMASTQRPVQWMLGVFTPRVKWLGGGKCVELRVCL
jgi:hypothetical protein